LPLRPDAELGPGMLSGKRDNSISTDLLGFGNGIMVRKHHGEMEVAMAETLATAACSMQAALQV